MTHLLLTSVVTNIDKAEMIVAKSNDLSSYIASPFLLMSLFTIFLSWLSLKLLLLQISAVFSSVAEY